MDAGFNLFGEHILWTDALGNVLSLAVVWLAMRKTVWTWPVQLVGAILLRAASVHAHVPGNSGFVVGLPTASQPGDRSVGS